VCTSKRTEFAERILELFGLRQHLTFVNGGDVGVGKAIGSPQIVFSKAQSNWRVCAAAGS
jgi:hypothetical protein